jgi:hypothetical protein
MEWPGSTLAIDRQIDHVQHREAVGVVPDPALKCPHGQTHAETQAEAATRG